MNFRWLTDPDATPLQIDTLQQNLPRTAIPHPDGLGEGWIELVTLALDMHLCRVEHQFRPGLQGMELMTEVVATPTEPLFFVKADRSGRGLLQDDHLGVSLEYQRDLCVFEHLDQVNHRHWTDLSSPVDVTALSFGMSKLRLALGEDLAAALCGALGIDQLPSARVQPVPRSIVAMLHSGLGNHLTGQLRKLHTQAKVLEFLVALSVHFVGGAPAVSRKVQRIRDLREELNQLNGVVPSLSELARRHGFSERVMSELFKREYGQTIYSHITDSRLHAAHAALLNSDTPMKVLAARLGYADVSHFSNAFTRKFGYRPGSLRRGKGLTSTF
ncbi:MAG: helix-turn-helix transcriptional regulator [Anderseniella sp.]|jgi:AraC-like DNA-binding protein|nr:helix-turn-helix transcriptional regulator [Anderseniella sp.]